LVKCPVGQYPLPETVTGQAGNRAKFTIFYSIFTQDQKMEENESFLIVMGVPSIKSFVFGTDKLKEIRGASALLDQMNRSDTKTELEKHLEGAYVKCVFAAGGAAHFIIQAPEDKIDSAMKKLEGYFATETGGGLRLIWGKSRLLKDDYYRSLKIANFESEKMRYDMPAEPCSSIHTGFIRECDSCSGMATPVDLPKDGERILCDSCRKKTDFNFNAKSLEWERFSKFLRIQGVVATRPDNLQEIGDQCISRKGYTALVYADGNAMGHIIREIKTADQFEFFSSIVDHAIRSACHESLYEVFFENQQQQSDIIPADILLLGGDDLVVYLSADAALPFAVSVAERFTDITKKKFADNAFFSNLLGEGGMTISLGIAYGKSKTPIFNLLNQAEELLKSAKQSGSFDKQASGLFTPTYIDFHVTTNYNQLSIEDCRAVHLQLGKKQGTPLKLYQKPYSLNETKSLLHHAKILKDLIPSTRLKRLGNAPALGKMNGTLECLKIYTRTPKGEKRTALQQALGQFGCFTNMPWKSHSADCSGDDYCSTVLSDLIEVIDFLP